MGGGPSQQQKQAAASQAGLAAQETQIAGERNARENAQYDTIKPYATSRLNSGLPFYGDLTDFSGGVNARAYAPVKGAILRRTSGMGLPSGTREKLLAGVDTARARGFDSDLVNNMLLNEQAKRDAAGLITNQQQVANPLGFYGAASGTNQSIMQAPLQSPGVGGLLAGIGTAAINKIPF